MSNFSSFAKLQLIIVASAVDSFVLLLLSHMSIVVPFTVVFCWKITYSLYNQNVIALKKRLGDEPDPVAPKQSI